MGAYAKNGDTVVCIDCGIWPLTNGSAYTALSGTDEEYVRVVGDGGIEGGFKQSRFRVVRSQAIESPIRTVTRRELVPGVYGRVSILRDGELCLVNQTGYAGSWHVPMKADELRSAAMIFSQLAEFLDEDKRGG